MRDIRADLRDRIEALSEKESGLARSYNRRMQELQNWFETESKLIQDERSAVQALFIVEMRRHGDDGRISAPLAPLQEFIVHETMKRGIASKEDLRLAASQRGYFPDGETGGRQIHTTVLNLVRANRMIEVQEGRYGVPSPDAVHGPPVQMDIMS